MLMILGFICNIGYEKFTFNLYNKEWPNNFITF